MTRVWLGLLTVGFCLSLAIPAFAQLDYDGIRSGTAGCPELAADPSVGDLAAFLCDVKSRTTLDLPINASGTLNQVRAGAFVTYQRADLLALVRGDLGEPEFSRLQGLLLAGAAPSLQQETLARALLSEAADPGTDPAQAASLRAQAAALISGSFDASIPELLAARVDRDRLADWRSGLLNSLVPRDTVHAYANGVALSLSGVALLAGLSPTPDAGGFTLLTPASALRSAYPLFVGPDGRANTSDDLPFVRTNPAAQAAGYSLAPPIAGTTQDRFDTVQGGIALFSQTAQRQVDSVASPGTPKTIEIYGVYNRPFLVRLACPFVGGIFDSGTRTCLDGGVDLSEAAFTTGCVVRASQLRSLAYGIGFNADGDCIEVNSSSTGSARVQFEVLPLLGDLMLRPVGAALEPVDLTDLLLRGDGLGPPIARPPGPSGNVVFPSAATPFSRNVDLVSGAPIAAGGAQCDLRVDAQSASIGPNGIAGDGDDVIPSAGECLLWGPPDAGGAQQPLAPGVIVSTQSANQSLYHTLCTVSFDPDTGHCDLDELNDPRTFGFIAQALSGLGFLGGDLLRGLDTVRTSAADLTQRFSFIDGRHFLAANPLATRTANNQDLGLVATREQLALLGCGPSFASPCSERQATQWRNDPAIAATLTSDIQNGSPQFGGIDLQNAAASVITQEFATVKALRADTLVGAAEGAGGVLAYLPGVNYSRNESLSTELVPGLGDVTREGGAYLALTPAQVIAFSAAARAAFQHGPPDKLQADGWVEPMPWAIDPDALSDFGAVVFRSDPNDPITGPDNVFNPTGGEYCGRWMNENEDDVETPFNRTCTALETVSANLERLIISREIVGQDRVFDPPESLDELVAILDGDPSNDATGDPIAGPDGIFARSQHVFGDAARDFEVLPAVNLNQLGSIQLEIAPASKVAALEFLLDYDPGADCAQQTCYLQINAVLSDPDDAQSDAPLVLVMPIGTDVDVVYLDEPNDPGDPPLVGDTGVDTKVNLARLQAADVRMLNRLFAGEPVDVNGQLVRMSPGQRESLFGQRGVQASVGRDLDADGVNDLDRDRDGVWDGMDDFTPGPVSDDEILCGSGLPGDLLQDGLQFEPHRKDEAPGSAAFVSRIGAALAPRSPVFCRELNALLALSGPKPGQSDAFLWHGGSAGAGTDDDADGFPDALDNCPTLANADQVDGDSDGVGNLCDNCVTRANPFVAAGFVTTNAWATLTGGQRDDDHDGYGNICDGDFTPTGVVVNATDLVQWRTANGKSRLLDTCGSAGNRPCAIFDLDGTGVLVNASDLARWRQLNGKAAGPKCTACPLVCEAGAQGSCN